ncbi:MAG: acyltransferase family protein [Pseudomonadota bacterium]
MSGAANASAHHPSLKYRADIDGLRGIAVALVVLFHAKPEWLTGGFVGVDVFFVISGYLITKILYGERQAGAFTYFRFYQRRIRRLLPAFSVVVLAVAGLSLWLSLPDHLIDTGQSIVAAGVFATNLLFWQEAGYFAGPAELKPLLHSWSLAVEEQFYFLYPLALFVGMWLWRKHGALAITLAIFAVSLLLSAVLTPSQPDAAFYLLPFRAWELMLGSILAITAAKAPVNAILRNLLVLVGLAMIVAASIFYSSATVFPGYAAMLPVFGSALVIYAAGSNDAVSKALLQNAPLVGLGKISYSLYLWHWPLFAFAHYRTIGDLPLWLVGALIVAALILSILSYRFVEQPFRKPGALEGWKPFSFAAASSIAMIGIGVVFMHTVGLPQRFDPEIRTIMETRADRDRSRKCQSNRDGTVAPSEACRFGAEDGPARIALWGDSHAHALVATLGRAAESRGAALHHYGFDGCPPLKRVRTPAKDGCEEFGQAVFAHMIADEGLDTVVIKSRHQVHLFGQTGAWGPAEPETTPNAWPNSSFEERLKKYSQSLEETVADLRAAGKRVVLVQPVPETAYDIPRVAALLAMQGETIDSFTRPRSMYESRAGDIRAAILEIGERQDVAVVDPSDYLCDAELCRVSDGGTLLYYDDDHLSGAGAQPLAEAIMDAAQ